MTHTTKSFVQPAVNGTVDVDIASTRGFSANEEISISGGGEYQICKIVSPTCIEVKNCGGSNPAPGCAVASNAKVSPFKKHHNPDRGSVDVQRRRPTPGM